MRSAPGRDLGAVAARFTQWRGRRFAGEEIPAELWEAAAGLVERYGATAVCERLRLNATRFKEVRARLERRARVEGAAGGWVATPNPARFLELAPLHLRSGEPALASPAVAASAGSPATCTLVLEGSQGVRLTIVLDEPRAEIIASVCRTMLGDARVERGRR